MAALGQRITLGPRYDPRSVAEEPRFLLLETPNESTMLQSALSVYGRAVQHRLRPDNLLCHVDCNDCCNQRANRASPERRLQVKPALAGRCARKKREKYKMENDHRTTGNWFALTGLLAGVFYLLHVVLGQLTYPGYDWMRQAVSDLTAGDSPSREIASSFSFLYGFLSCVSCSVLCVIIAGKYNRTFRTGIYLYTAMNFFSFVGYTLFPLTSRGFQGTFQDIMHFYVVTLGVVLLSISSLATIGVSGFRAKGNKKIGLFSLVVLTFMFLGSIGIGMVPKEFFGLFERFSIFGVVIFTSVLGVFGFSVKNENQK
jgi:hypothetical protein